MPRKINVVIVKLHDLTASQFDSISLSSVLPALSDLDEQAVTALYTIVP